MICWESGTFVGSTGAAATAGVKAMNTATVKMKAVELRIPLCCFVRKYLPLSPTELGAQDFKKRLMHAQQLHLVLALAAHHPVSAAQGQANLSING